MPDGGHGSATGAVAQPALSIIWSAVAFVALTLGFESVLLALNGAGALTPLIEATAHASGVLIALSGVPVTVLGDEVFLSQRILLINLECTGVYIMAAYAALVIVWPAGWRAKAVGIAVGLPAITIANVVRLVLVAQVAERLPGSFDLLHDYLFQVALVMIAAAVWVVWISRVRSHEG
jgi:archaeosortase B (VPXXXP-CTERM-specific)